MRNFCNGGLTCSSGLILLTCLLFILSQSTSIIAAPFEHGIGAEIPDLTVSNNNVNEHKCPILACRLKCVFEQAVNEAGCRICACTNPCRDIICPEGETCELAFVNCFRAPCPPRKPICVKIDSPRLFQE